MADLVDDFLTGPAKQRVGWLPRGFSGTLRIDLRRNGRSEHWFIEFREGTMSVSRDGEREADCVVCADGPAFDQFVTGGNAPAAGLRNEVSYRGSPEVLIYFQRLLPGPHRRWAGRVETTTEAGSAAHGDVVSIMEGLTFLVSDENGDIDSATGDATGLYFLDTRFLSTWTLSVNSARLTPLSIDDLQYYEARFFLVPGEPTHYVNATVSVIRHRSTVAGIEEQITVLNHCADPVELTIRLDIGADFADIAERRRPPSHRKGRYQHAIGERTLRLRYERAAYNRETVITTTEPARIDSSGMTFAVPLDAQGCWSTQLRVTTEVRTPAGVDLAGGALRTVREVRAGMAEELDRWLAHAPRLNCDSEALSTAYRRSLIDLAALRLPSLWPGEKIPAAGLPWLVTLVGRQSILTSLQVLPFLPELAAATLRFLALYQGTKVNDFLEEEPGKIAHLLRRGELAAFEELPHSQYYGSADATPLFVILLDEYERWTGDTELVCRLELEARAALDWLDRCGDLTGDGYLWYQRPHAGSEPDNQCWKESTYAVAYADGRLPGWPRATCELQGYAYDAKMRGARLARTVWGDPVYADRLERQATDLRKRFNRDFWLPDRGYYALAREPDGALVDALASNLGHLLWSGIVDPDRAGSLVDHLMGPELFSGWGIRTLAAGQSRFNPLGEHVGAVWPHDNAITAEGMRRYGFTNEAGTVVRSIFDTLPYLEGRLPEAFAGHDRKLTRYPVRFGTSGGPQGWSSGALMLLLRTLLGLQPHDDHLVVKAAIPAGLGNVALLDVTGRWGTADAIGRPT
ncbi:glycogen debranching N-terminal domain-containing protein [Plantactinospora sp. CA-290183]|uniref:glycogen debranching N-terminal domain-containing protein n=1 Tax=Plantactinospora sp. CA-290183 TaxID=3240006 RepID=UPI003D8A8F6B